MDLVEVLEDSENSRQIVTLPNGRRTLKRDGRTLGLGIVHLTYLNRAFEWTHLKKAIVSWLRYVHLEEKIDEVDLITIGWKHLPSIKELVYFPKSVFCDFEVLKLMTMPEPCAYSHKRWVSFLDLSTLETCNTLILRHVRTSNLTCIQNKELGIFWLVD